MYRHDPRQSSVSPAKGNIASPVIQWEHYLGVPFQSLVSTTDRNPWSTDLDGDGERETVVAQGPEVYVIDGAGQRVWSHAVHGTASQGRVRLCHLWPDAKGPQAVVFTSRMDTGEGQGYCFRFDEGVEKGRLAWTTGPLTGQHAPTLIVDDVDGDGVQEIVNAPHYRVQIFDGRTGELEAEVPWDVGRNYGILLTRPRSDSAHKDIFIVCDFVLHVDCIRHVDGEWTHDWGHKYVNPNVMDAHANVGVVFACLIGGAGKLYGALLGGVVYMIISNFLPIYIQRWEMFLGLILLIIVFRFDKGIWGYIETGWAYLRQRKGKPEGPGEATRR